MTDCRPMPCDVQAEESVVGAVLGTPETLDTVRPILKPEHFWDDKARTVFEAFCALSDDGKAFDAVTVFGWLKDHDKALRVGGIAYLAETLGAVPHCPRIEEQAMRVRDKWRLRQLIAECRRTEAQAFDAEDANAFVACAERRLLETTSAYQRVKPSRIKDVIVERFKDLQSRTQASREVMVCTGLRPLDRVLVGWQPSDFAILAARPGMGKTSMALNNIALHSAERGQGVAVFSLEMSREQLVDRVVCCGASVNSRLVPTGELSADDWSRMTAEAQRLSRLPIRIDDEPAIQLSTLRAKARRMAAEFEREGTPLRLVVVDYLQLMGVDNRLGNRDEKVGANSQGLKAMAKELGVTVLALAQLNREVEKRGKNAKPQLSDLRESGNLEQDADSVLFICNDPSHPPSFDSNGSRVDGPALVEVAKGRHFGTGRAGVMWCPSRTRFFELERNEPDDWTH